MHAITAHEESHVDLGVAALGDVRVGNAEGRLDLCIVQERNTVFHLLVAKRAVLVRGVVATLVHVVQIQPRLLQRRVKTRPADECCRCANKTRAALVALLNEVFAAFCLFHEVSASLALRAKDMVLVVLTARKVKHDRK